MTDEVDLGIVCNYYVVPVDDGWRLMIYLPSVWGEEHVGIRTFKGELEALKMVNQCNKIYAEMGPGV